MSCYSLMKNAEALLRFGLTRREEFNKDSERGPVKRGSPILRGRKKGVTIRSTKEGKD